MRTGMQDRPIVVKVRAQKQGAALLMRDSLSIFRGFVLLFAGALAFSGCASEKPPSIGDRILAFGDSHRELGEQWHEAEEMKDQAEDDVRAAEAAIKQAEKDLEDAQDDLVDANKRLVKSRRALAEAEGEFHRRFPGQVPSNPE
jgi:septal ring factor EnvC (AmiA/AmiB activator)